MGIRFYIALLVGKLISVILKMNGSGATAAPGLYALKIDPDFVKKFSKQFKHGSIIVSGTNGKTTTSRLIYTLLENKYKIIHNRQGSNLLRGIASTFINNSVIFKKNAHDIALWEVDEAVLPLAIKNTNPKTIILLNLFRDQLDRYGEIDTIRKNWQSAIEQTSKTTMFVLNADDPGTYFLKKFIKGKIFSFGVEAQKLTMPQIENVSDAKYCPNCNSALIFTKIFSSHIGHYKCSSCAFKRNTPAVLAKKITFSKNFKTKATIITNYSNPLILNINLPGLYNVYNTLAATAVALTENVDASTVIANLEKFSSAFGRFQKLEVNGKNIIIFLIKNPAGANEVLRTIAINQNIKILALLNDNVADGKDVSWIWDTNWEILANKISSASVSGSRAWDLANRFKYAGIKLSKNNVYEDINYSITHTLNELDNKDTLFILPTYTGLLKIQETLNKLSNTSKWQNN